MLFYKSILLQLIALITFGKNYNFRIKINLKITEHL
jgi:hypothetical protein